MPFFGGGGAAPANMVGATSSVAGTAGLVPAPASGTENLFLKGNATFGWLYPQSTDYANTEYHGPFMSSGNQNAASNLQNTRLYLTVLVISGSKTFNRIGFRFGSVASCDARIGLYECDTANFRPSSLVVGSTALNGSTNTNIEYTISPSITLKNKIYFGALAPSLATSMNCNATVQYDVISYFGASITSTLGNTFSRLYVDFNYAALPSDLSTYTIKIESGNAPIVYLRNV